MFDWTNYLELARGLAQGSDEASQRSAISRAYYAAFNNARLWLDSQGVTFTSRESIHRQVWDEFLKSGATSQQQIGSTGDKLRARRARADYEDAIVDLSRQVTIAIQQAEELLNGLSKL